MTQIKPYLAIIGDRAFPPTKDDSAAIHYSAIVTAQCTESAKQAADDAIGANFNVVAVMPIEEFEQLYIELLQAPTDEERVELLDEEAMLDAIGQ